MRADLLHLTKERDHATNGLVEMSRRAELLDTDVQNLKGKINKLQSEKMQLERDYRSAQSMIGSLQGSINGDVEYYKRKVSRNRTVMVAV